MAEIDDFLKKGYPTGATIATVRQRITQDPDWRTFDRENGGGCGIDFWTGDPAVPAPETMLWTTFRDSPPCRIEALDATGSVLMDWVRDAIPMATRRHSASE